MPDSVDDIVQLLRRASEAMEQQVQAAQESVRHLLESSSSDDGDRLPHRISTSIAGFYDDLVELITGHGTLPRLHMPSLSVHDSEALARFKRPPPPPPTFVERIAKRIQDRPYLYGTVIFSTVSVCAAFVAVNVSPNVRAVVLRHVPALSPMYIRRRRALPPPPRPRLSPDGKRRVDAVLILGADEDSYGRHIAKAFERAGFVVIASVSSESQTDALEHCGSGHIKAVVLDPRHPSKVNTFVRSLNTALSLRYPLNSAGDPFAHSSNPALGLQLVSVINCLCISTPFSGGFVPFEAVSVGDTTQAFACLVTTPLAVIRSLMPLLRSRDTYNTPASIITCLPAPDRYVGTPFSGTNGAMRGIASNALVQALDVVRRELAVSDNTGNKRSIDIINLDVGFLQPAGTRKTHRGVSHALSSVAPQCQHPADVSASLPLHLRSVYTYPLVASLQGVSSESSRRSLPDASALSDKLLKIVCKPTAFRLSDRLSVGRGVMTYYIASLLPTRCIDVFFNIRQSVLNTYLSRRGELEALAATTPRVRKPIQKPGSASSTTSSDNISDFTPSRHASRTSSEFGSEACDTVLPAYAPSAPASTQPSGHASEHHSPTHGHVPLPARGGIASGYDSPASGTESLNHSGVLGESFVRV